MFQTIKDKFGGVDVCINNAGLAFNGSLLDGDVEKWRTILNVNVLALAHCTQLAVRSMKERNVSEGQVININSLSGHRVVPNPNVHFYAASKYAVTALTEGLRQELAADQPTRIRVAVSSASTRSPHPRFFLSQFFLVGQCFVVIFFCSVLVCLKDTYSCKFYSH